MTARRQGGVLSESWHQVSQLRPTLQPHIRVSLHSYRDEPWYVLSDATKGRSHRIGLAGWRIIEQLNGMTTIDQAWRNMMVNYPALLPSQIEVVELLGQLHLQDLLRSDSTPDALEVLERHSKSKRQKWMQWLISPLSPKIPLINPAKWVTALASMTSWIWTWPMFILWLLVVSTASFFAIQHSQELAAGATGYLFSPANWLALGLVYGVLKIIHETGHALATRSWGGSITQAGVMLLVFAPSPYVDTSSASAFPSKWRRVVVGGAGMIVELFVASLAMFCWVLVEPGWVKSLCLAIMLVAGISTVIVNANPLLKFDGYFMLCDALELPNLAQRGSRLLTTWFDRVVCGAREVQSPERSWRVKVLLSAHTIAAWIFKFFLTLTIVVFVGQKFFAIGLLLAAWSVFGLLVIPSYKAIKHVWTSPQLLRTRARAKFAFYSITAIAMAVLFAVKLPMYTQALGVVAVTDNATVRPETAGEFVRWLVLPGAAVSVGTPLAELTNKEIESEHKASQARLLELEARYLSQSMDASSGQGGILLDQRNAEQARAKRLRDRLTGLTIKSTADGSFVVDKPTDTPGRFIKNGETLAYVSSPQNLILRVVIDQSDEEIISQGDLKKVEVKFASNTAQVFDSAIVAVTPGGVNDIPSPALTQDAGGYIPVDPTSGEKNRSLHRIFVLDLKAPPETSSNLRIGERVHVRFTSPAESLASQMYRRTRQAFLNYFAT